MGLQLKGANVPKLYFESTKTGKRYEVVRFDKAAGEVVLKGEHAQFTEKFSKERFTAMGYKPVQVDDDE